MKISDTPFYKTTPLFYQPLPFYRKNLTLSLFAKISKSQLLLFIKEGGVPTMFKFWVGVWVLEIFARRGFNGTFHKFWIIFKKSATIRSCHCTCMTGTSETCNHVAVAVLRLKAEEQIHHGPVLQLNDYHAEKTLNQRKSRT